MEKKRLYIHDKIGFVELVDQMQNDVALKVVNSARISHASKSKEYDEKDKKLTGYLFSHGHTSPFRHTYYTFHIKAGIFVFNQFKKYQVGSAWRSYELEGKTVSVDIIDEMYDTDKGCSWNEISGRYAQLKAEFYFPEVIRGPVGHNKQGSKDWPLDYQREKDKNNDQLTSMNARCIQLYELYLKDIDNNVSKEIARMTLPMNIYSQAYWTVSLQGVMHFLEQRLKPDAQQEIQDYAKALYKLVKIDLDKIGYMPDAELTE